MQEWNLLTKEKLTNRIKRESSFSNVRWILLSGFLIRLMIFLLIAFEVITDLDPYMVIDDIKYEGLAEYYFNYANSVFDFKLFDRMTVGYAQQFWPFVMCASAKLFNNILAGRVINIFLSTATIWVLYKLAFEISGEIKTALLVAKLFAFMPLPVLTSCFPIKDIFLTFSVMYAFYLFVCLQKGNKVSAFRLILGAVLLVCTYFTRGAVVELLLIFLVVYYAQKLIIDQKYAQLLLFGFVALIVALIFKDTIISSFQTKIDVYSNYGEGGNGINFVKVTSIRNIYKLPLTYAFATLQPITLDYVDGLKLEWQSMISFLNISIYPIAVGNFMYMFSKKHNLFFWLSSFIMYSAVIVLSLGVYRHYLFLLPLEMINFALYIERDKRGNLLISILGAAGLFLIIFAATAFDVF